MPFFKDLACKILREQYGCTCDRTGSRISIRNPKPKLWDLDKEPLPAEDNVDVCMAIKKLARLESKVGTGPVNDDE